MSILARVVLSRGIIATPDDMEHMSETKDLAFGMVDTIKEGEYGFTLNLYERTHYAIREKGKEFTGNPRAITGSTTRQRI
ncbi:MAG: hypothetical protein V8R50_11510 [Clostridia bacterium]